MIHNILMYFTTTDYTLHLKSNTFYHIIIDTTFYLFVASK